MKPILYNIKKYVCIANNFASKKKLNYLAIFSILFSLFKKRRHLNISYSMEYRVCIACIII